MTEKSKLLHREQTDHDDHHNNHGDDYQENDDGGGSGVGGCRWNPTKEQIELLESIYNNEGVRTPSADQIQEITTRLRVYGHIEGKNVFYWFQNHKARQRQKQRQERLAAAAAANVNLNANYYHNNNNNNGVNHVNRFLSHPPSHLNHYHPLPNYGISGVNPMFHPNYAQNYLPNPNVICSPYYNHQLTTNNDVGYYPLHSPQYNYSATAPPDHHHHALMKRSSPSTKHMLNSVAQRPRVSSVPHGSTLTGYCAAMMTGQYDGRDMMSRTLDLFPVHPTGILEHKFDMISTNDSGSNTSGESSSPESRSFGDQNRQMFLDFFSIDHGLSESD
ncbi:hypothetical protein RND81_04G166200 [Saponaria officinalis]|uniref:Homeobox domain-containing protein n=1 Tax=Saponaria officinalis TaxID=3572 RepID=A0AAW1LM22_SAPOF